MLFLRTLKFLPADVLDVVVAANGKPDATSEPPPFKHGATICACHPLAETMHTHAPPNFRLIGSFRCHSQLPRK
jgi:hypothetical protein